MTNQHATQANKDLQRYEKPIDSTVKLRTIWWSSAPDTDLIQIASKKSALVFLHGTADGADVWDPVVRSVADKLPLPAIAFDFPGHGGSEGFDDGIYTTQRMIEAVESALIKMRINYPILVGHSLGGSVSANLMERGKITPSLCILVDPSMRDTANVDDNIRAHIKVLANGGASLADLIQAVEARMALADPEALKTVLPSMSAATQSVRPNGVPNSINLAQGIEQVLSDTTCNDLIDLLPRISNRKIALIRGQFSAVLSQKDANLALARTQNRMSLTVIERAGHAIPFEQPEKLGEAVAKAILTYRS
ncbi:alpha/beta fold hydrolase [Roseibium sp. RKSG952]|uniref:alpha/beta fold hydrolase n=1 Tax=Roseibium sp. RKSG952 TaxID=2529384 RepID=UPI0012BBC244|nr:alpha/beta hydrolase [Roseibium sp. RKSG952]MTH97692.1 alpha/beta hydrolase [Roseibium sp. RKSG952]